MLFQVYHLVVHAIAEVAGCMLSHQVLQSVQAVCSLKVEIAMLLHACNNLLVQQGMNSLDEILCQYLDVSVHKQHTESFLGMHGHCTLLKLFFVFHHICLD